MFTISCFKEGAIPRQIKMGKNIIFDLGTSNIDQIFKLVIAREIGMNGLVKT